MGRSGRKGTCSSACGREPVVLRADGVSIAPGRLRVHPVLTARAHRGLTAREVASVQDTAVAPFLLGRQGATDQEVAEQLGLPPAAAQTQLQALRELGVATRSTTGRWYLLDIGALALHPLPPAEPPPARRLSLVPTPA
ncbi:MAG: winged helix-turn-helix domain-containing protein [Actinomycetota bacterium]|nr:winged helix-turn-helix domain-containing protein [Actinomycetota bacterium]